MPAFLSAAVVFLAYLPVLRNAFVNWDDTERIVGCAPIRSWGIPSIQWMFTSLSGSYWMPLTWLSFALDHSLGGLDPRVYHLTNAVLHALNSALVFMVCFRILVLAQESRGGAQPIPGSTHPMPAALLAALLFGLHPIHVESVAWATERKDVLYAFFYLGALLLYLDMASSPGRKGWRYFSCLGCFAMALMSKPMAVTLPLVFLIADAWPLRRWSSRLGAVLTEKIPFILLALPVVLVTLQAPAHTKASLMTGDFPLAFRIANACRSLFFYLWKMLVPTDLVPLYPFPRVQSSVYHAQGVLAVLAVVLISLACFYYRKKAPYLAAAWLFYGVSLAPVLGIVRAGGQAAADRFTYLPSLGIFLLFSALLSRWLSGRRKLFVLSGAVLTVLLGIRTVGQIGIWRDSPTLWENVIRVYPDENHFAHSNLAACYAEAGRLQDALREYERAIAIPPPWAQVAAMAGRAAVLADLGRENEAVQELKRALTLDPQCILAHQNLWVLYGRKGMFPEALAEIQKAVALEPGNAENHNKLGVIYIRMGKWDEAAGCYRRCIELDPFDPGYLINLGSIHMQLKEYPRAVEMFRTAYRLQPRNPDLAFRLAQACEKAGMIRQAEQYAAEARALTGPTRP